MRGIAGSYVVEEQGEGGEVSGDGEAHAHRAGEGARDGGACGDGADYGGLGGRIKGERGGGMEGLVCGF